MKSKYLFLLIVLLPISLLAQDATAIKLNFIENLSFYRSQLMLKDTAGLYRLQEVTEKFIGDGSEPNEEFIDFLYGVKQLSDYKPERALDLIRARSTRYPILDSLTLQDLELLLQHHEFLDLIGNHVLSPNYPYPLIANKGLLDEILFYNISDKDSIAEIGAGFGTFGLFLCMTGTEMNLQLNELDISQVVNMKKRFRAFFEWFAPMEYYVINGKKSKAKLRGKLDKIIIRNSFHHFSKKNKMLLDLQKSLKDDGVLIISENLRSIEPNPSDCELRIDESTILNHAAVAGLKLIEKAKVNYFNSYKFKFEKD